MSENWIKQIAAGDYEAFKAVYEAYGRQVYRRALEQTGDKEQAKNVLKQVFQTLLYRLRKKEEDPLLILLEGLTDLQVAKLPPQKETAAKEFVEEAADPQTGLETAEEIPAEKPVTENPAEGFEKAEDVTVVPTEEAAEQMFVVEKFAAEEAVMEDPVEELTEEQSAEFSTAEKPATEETEFVEDPTEEQVEEVPLNCVELDLQEEYEALEAEHHLHQMELNADLLPQKEAESPKKKKKFGRFLFVFLLIVVILVALWVGIGILMAEGILPAYDLGYSWFDQNVYSVFRLGANG